MTTLSDLHSLLTMALTYADNPALRRCERTAKALLVAYLPPMLPARNEPGDQRTYIDVVDIFDTHVFDHYALALEVPGTAHALLVGLALAKGLDPGPCALDVGWRPFRGGTGRCGWMLATASMNHVFLSRAENCQMVGREIFGAPPVALEPNPIAALEAAVKHTSERT